MTVRSCLPGAATPEEFERAVTDETALRRGVHAICERNGLDASAIERFANGSVPVYAVGDALVLKLCPPFAIEERDNEALALQVVERRLPIPTPEVRAVGELDGWGYVLMSRLEGISLAEAWPLIGGDDRLQLAQSIGEALSALHAIRDPRLMRIRQEWNRFIVTQKASCVERQRLRGLDAFWLDQIPGFLEAAPLGAEASDALLHTEVMREHILVREGAEGWSLSGLFDFEPAMTGAPEYEFAAVGLFVSCGDPQILRRVLTAYGYSESRLDAATQNRFLAYTLIHRYCNLPWYFRRLPPPEGTRTLEALAAHWWGLGEVH